MSLGLPGFDTHGLLEPAQRLPSATVPSTPSTPTRLRTSEPEQRLPSAPVSSAPSTPTPPRTVTPPIQNSGFRARGDFNHFILFPITQRHQLKNMQPNPTLY